MADRHWCKHSMFRHNFLWIFKKPYDYDAGIAKAREGVSDDEIRQLQDSLKRIGNDTMFAALDAG